MGTYQLGELIFQCHIFLPFHTVHGILKARMLKWFATAFSSGPHFVRTRHYDPSTLGHTHLKPTRGMAHSFIELDKAMIQDLNDPDNHDGVVTHLETDILEWEVNWALGSITTNKASGGDGIPVELFQIVKDDAVKVLHSICQQIWKTHQ